MEMLDCQLLLIFTGSPPLNIVTIQAYRFLIGIGVGAEYRMSGCQSYTAAAGLMRLRLAASGSVAAAENTEDPGVAKKSQQKYLILATNTAIDFGFVLA